MVKSTVANGFQSIRKHRLPQIAAGIGQFSHISDIRKNISRQTLAFVIGAGCHFAVLCHGAFADAFILFNRCCFYAVVTVPGTYRAVIAARFRAGVLRAFIPVDKSLVAYHIAASDFLAFTGRRSFRFRRSKCARRQHHGKQYGKHTFSISFHKLSFIFQTGALPQFMQEPFYTLCPSLQTG